MKHSVKLKERIIGFILAFLMVISVVGYTNYPASAAVAADWSEVETGASNSQTKGVLYCAHVQGIGWQDYAANGSNSGTYGQGRRLEAIRIKLQNLEYTGGVTYRTHVQGIGWQNWVANDALAGTTGQAKRLEAVQIKLTGEVSNYYDIYYRTHIQHFGWTGWAKNGASCGSGGYSYRMESLQVRLVPKNGQAPGAEKNTFYNNNSTKVEYRSHVQSFGWMNYVSNGKGSGTIGGGKRLEAIDIRIKSAEYTGGISYSGHVQSYGWMPEVSNGADCGVTGQAKRLEAIKIHLYGEIAEHYDVYYRAHVQTYGWQSWRKNGEVAGTQGEGKRIEAIQIFLNVKGNDVKYPEHGLTPLPTKRIRQIDPNKPMIALTYDDGPNGDVTNRILDALEKVDGRATFFVVGNRVSYNTTVLKRASQMGNQIGNHTWSHQILTKVDNAHVKSEIEQCNRAVFMVTGQRPTMLRPPGGGTSPRVIDAVDVPMINWSIDTLDWKNRNANSVYNHVIGRVRDGDIVLMHDLYKTTASASERIIPELVREGYQLVTVEELAYYKGYKPKGHTVYNSFR